MKQDMRSLLMGCFAKKLLIDAGADVNFQTPNFGDAALFRRGPLAKTRSVCFPAELTQ
jgi:hypothetical protein